MVSRLRVLLVISTLVTGFSLFAEPQHTLAASSSVGFTTSPVSLDLSIKPGASTTQTLQFKNNGSIAVPVTMQVQIFGAYGSAGEAAITEPSPGNTSTQWVSFSPASFIAQPNAWQSVKMTIKLPPTASLGYYYAVIFKPTLPTPTPTAGSNTIKGSNAILVLVDSGTANEQRQVQIANFSVTKHIYQYLPVTFNITLHNNGNIYLAPSGDIFISRHSNMTNTIATIPFNDSGANVLPNSVRDFVSNWSDGFPVYEQKQLDGQPETNPKGLPVEQLVWNFSKANKLRFGKYYAQLTMSYSNGTTDKLVISQVSFWVIPWELILLAVFLVIALIVIWHFFKRFIRRIWRVIFRQKLRK